MTDASPLYELTKGRGSAQPSEIKNNRGNILSSTPPGCQRPSTAAGTAADAENTASGD